MSIINSILILFSGLAFIFYGLAILLSSKMQEEFVRFGLAKFHKLTGILELLGGLGLLVGLISNRILLPSSLGLGLLMTLGFAVRLKMRDSFVDSFPSLFFMILNTYLFITCLD